VGGFAVVVHGASMTTRDLDVCCRFDEANLLRLGAAVSDLHPVHRMRPDLPLVLTSELCATYKNLYLKTDLGVLDCLSEIRGLGNFDEVLKHSVVAELPFGECRVLDIDALIRAKEAMNRDHDKLAVTQLKAIREHQAGK